MKISLDGDVWTVELENMQKTLHTVPTIQMLKDSYMKIIEKQFDNEINNIVVSALNLKNELNNTKE